MSSNQKLMISSIYHEKQTEAMCAKHAINNLLQGKYTTEQDLMEIAHTLDRKEEQVMAEKGKHTKEYLEFLKRGSINVSDDGNFSLAVVQECLQIWGISLYHLQANNPISKKARTNPDAEQAFLCNHASHWFCFRKFGKHWFNLNSLLSEPEYLSPTYISLFIEQLRAEGYSIFVCKGNFPDCKADIAALEFDPSQYKRPQPKKTTTSSLEDEELRKAIELSLKESQSTMDTDDYELEIAKAISLSIQQPVQTNITQENSETKPKKKEIVKTKQPPPSGKNCTILFKLPDGSKKEEIFDAEHTIIAAYEFIQSLDNIDSDFDLVTNYPTKVLPKDKTFAQENLCPKSVIIVKLK